MSEVDSDRLLAVLHHILNREGVSGMVYLDIVKVFYLLRRRVSDDNELKSQLQYYWYIDGPESDTVQAAVDYGIETGMLETTATAHTGTGTWFEPTASSQLPDSSNYDDDVEEAIEEANKVLDEEYDLFDQKQSKIEPIYDEAPYEFQQQFKFEIIPEIKHFVDNDPWACSADKLNTIIASGEAYLPLEPEFREFNDLYSRFAEVASRYLRRISETDEDRFTGEFQQLAQNYIWQVFSQQLRIQHHDDYYDESVEEWEQKYKQQRMSSIQALEDFEENVEIMKRDKPASNLASPGSAWASIATDFIDN